MKPAARDAAAGSLRHDIVEAPPARWALPAALALAFVLRVVHLIALYRSPFFQQLELDHRFYDEWGQRIAQGELVGHDVFFVDPLYAYFLGAHYAVFGHSLLWPRLTQLCLGVGTVWLTARIARRTFDSERLEVVAAFVLALYVPAVYYDGALEKTSLSVFLFTLALERFLQFSPRAALSAGLALGCALLTRGNLLPFVPLGAFVLWRVDSAGLAGAARLRARPERALAFLLPALTVLAICSVRNYAVGHEWVLTTANAGQNLYIGQARENQTGTYRAPSFAHPDPRYEEADFHDEAVKRMGHPLSAGETSAYWTARALHEIAEAPGQAALHTLKKCLLLVHQFELPDSENPELIATYSPLLRIPILGMALLVALALVGAWRSFRSEPRARLLVLLVLVYLLSIVAFFVLGRFRVLIVPVLAVLAARGVQELSLARLESERARWWSAAVPVVAVTALLSVRPEWLETKRREALAIAYHNLATSLSERGDEQGALHAHEQAVAIDDRAVMASLRELGEIYLRQHEYARAERAMTRVLELKPDSPKGRDALARLYRAMASDPAGSADATLAQKLRGTEGALAPVASAPDAPGAPGSDPARAQALYRQSREARAAGRFGEAIEALQQAIAVGNYDENAHYLLGQLMTEHATPEEMIRYWSAAVASDPKPQTAYFFWARGLERSADDEGALAKLRSGLELDPAHELSELELCRIFERRKQLEQALEHCRASVDILPEFRDGHTETAQVLSLLGRDAEAESERTLASRSDPTSKRAPFYWARYLAKKGRKQAALREVQRALAALPEDREARELLEQLSPSSAGAPGPLSDEQRARLLAKLRNEPAGTPVWLAVYTRDPAAQALAEALKAVFAQAGWQLAGTSEVSFPLKAGQFVFAADESPPSYVTTLSDGLGAIGLTPTLGFGYRAFYQDRLRADASYRGFPLAAAQSYVLVIGPRPPS